MKKATISGLVTVIVAIAMVIVCGIGSNWFRNGDTKTWFDNWGQGTVETELPNDAQGDSGKPVTDENGTRLPNDETINLPKAMTFRSATSLDGKDAEYDSVTVRIKVTPVETDIKSITYTATWVNAASEWAKGKNVSDFLSVKQTTENSTDAIIQCLKPLGEQVKITAMVTSQDDASASAECIVDFAKRVEKIEMTLTPLQGDAETVSTDSSNYTMDMKLNSSSMIKTVCSYTDFTVEDEFKTEVKVTANENVLAQMNEDIGYTIEVSSAAIGSTFAFDYMFYATNDSYLHGTVKTAVYKWLRENTGPSFFSFTFIATGEYSRFEKSVPVHFNNSALVVSVSGVSFEESNVII